MDRVAEFLEELARDWDRARVLIVGPSATRWALDHLLAGAALPDLVAAPFTWQEGWSYALPAGWQRPGPAPSPGPPAGAYTRVSGRHGTGQTMADVAGSRPRAATRRRGGAMPGPEWVWVVVVIAVLVALVMVALRLVGRR